MNLSFFAHDVNNLPLGQLDAFTKVEFVCAYNGAKGWYAEIPDIDAAAAQVEMMMQATTLVIKNNGDAIYTGTVDNFDYDSEKNILTVSGMDALALEGRRVLPVPAGPPYTSAEYDVRTGAAESIIKQYVSYNAGPLAKVDRAIPWLSIETDYVRGDSHTARARFDDLTEFICQIALAKDLGVRVLAGQFEVYLPEDKSASIVFSDVTDTLGKYQYHIGKPKANYLYGAGSGSGTSQAFYERGDGASIASYGRRENYVNVGRTAVDTEIAAQLDAELQKQACIAWFEFEIVETPDREFWTDFWLGNLVSVQARSVVYTTRLAELTVSVAADGSVTTKPLFVNNASYLLSLRTYDRLRQMEQRLARLEQK